MRKLKKAIKYIVHDRKKFLESLLVNLYFLFPDKLYLTLLFRLKMGRWINWREPKTYNEKLQWLKLYNRRGEYTQMVDKYEVKEYVRKLIGEEYIIPTIGVWDNVDDIDFNTLPDQFVLKTTHSGGNTGVVICKDKHAFNFEEAKAKLRRSLKQSIYAKLREWPYKNVKPRILAENYLSDNINNSLLDYKFYCFNGVPKILVLSSGRNEMLSFDYYDMDFNHLPFQQGGPNSSKPLSCPINFDKMKQISGILSQNLPHVRVDFYEVGGKVYFGELTFFDSSGMAAFTPEEWDYKFGEWIQLPEN